MKTHDEKGILSICSFHLPNAILRFLKASPSFRLGSMRYATTLHARRPTDRLRTEHRRFWNRAKDPCWSPDGHHSCQWNIRWWRTCPNRLRMTSSRPSRDVRHRSHAPLSVILSQSPCYKPFSDKRHYGQRFTPVCNMFFEKRQKRSMILSVTYCRMSWCIR